MDVTIKCGYDAYVIAHVYEREVFEEDWKVMDCFVGHRLKDWLDGTR
jgi:hypothetical protein